MKKFCILVLFFLQTLGIYAQTTPMDAGRINLLTSDDRFQYINPFDKRNVPVVGERYFFDSIFRPGELKTAKSLYTKELIYRFDQIERTVQVQMDNGKRLFLFERDIEYCKLFIEKDTVLFVPITIPNGRKLTMVQVIYKSPTIQLYRDVRKYIFRVKSENIDGYSSEKIYDDVRKDYRYYLRKGDVGAFMEVKAEAKSLSSVLPEKHSQIEQLFRAGQKAKGGLTVSKLAEIMAALDKTEVK